MIDISVAEWQLHTPVAFIIFNRPETTERVFSAIAEVRPPMLLIIADGPRLARADDHQNCVAARNIIERVDWPCEVIRNYADSNLGCRRRVSSGLDWVFSLVEEAIILEDDCLPHPTFFRFCEEMLDRYRDDSLIMHISGDDFLLRQKRNDASYRFSRYPHVWGWASWRRAWRHYDVNMIQWAQTANKNAYLDRFDAPDERRFWKLAWNATAAGKADTWDYQWTFANMARQTLAVVPNVNLVSNIGFSQDSTHTTQESPVANLAVEAMEFPLVHPATAMRDIESDELIRRLFFSAPWIGQRIVNRVKQRLSRNLRV